MGRRRTWAICLGLGLFMSLVAAPSGVAGPSSSTTTSSCSLPATDLCTDYVFRGARWASTPVPYYINPTGAPAGAEQAIHDSFLTWQNETKSPAVETLLPGDHSALSFVYMGLTSARGARDGKNVVYFTPCDRCDAGSASRYVKGGKILEGDIFLNASRVWSTDLSCPPHDCGGLDLQSVATHEIGHVIDLYHVTSEAAARLTMYPGGGVGEIDKRDLGAGDVLGLRRAYPQ